MDIKGVHSSRVIRRFKNNNDNNSSQRVKKIHRINLDGTDYKNQVEKIKSQRYSKFENNNNNFSKKDANDYFSEITKNKNLKQKIFDFENKIRNLKSDNNIPIKKIERKQNLSIPRNSFANSRQSIKLTSSSDFKNPKKKLINIKSKNIQLEDIIKNLQEKFNNISQQNKNYESPIEKIENLQNYYEENIRKNSIFTENNNLSSGLKLKKNNSLGPMRFSKILKRTPSEVIEQITTLKIETTNDSGNEILKKQFEEIMKKNNKDNDYINSLHNKLLEKEDDLISFKNQVKFLEKKNKELLNQNQVQSLKMKNQDILIQNKQQDEKNNENQKKSIFITKKLNDLPKEEEKYVYSKKNEVKGYFVRPDDNEELNYEERNDNYKNFVEKENQNNILELEKSKKNIVKLKKDYEEIVKKLNFANFELDNKTSDIMELNEKILLLETSNKNTGNLNENLNKNSDIKNLNEKIHKLELLNSKLNSSQEKNLEIIKKKNQKLEFLENEMEKLKSENGKNLKKILNEKLTFDNSNDKMKEFYSTMIRNERNTEDDKYSVINAQSQKDIYKILNDLGLKDNLVSILNLKLRNVNDINESYKKKIDGLYEEIEDLKLIEINYFNQIKDLETEIDLINNDGDKFENNFKIEMEKAKKFYESEMFKLNESNENRLIEQKDLIRELEEKVNNLNHELKNSIDTITILEQQLSEMENSGNNRLDEVLLELNENKNLLENLLIKKQELEEEIINIKPFYENQLDEMTNNFENIMKEDKERILRLEEELRYFKNQNEDVPSSLRNVSIHNKTNYERIVNDKNNLENLLKDSENKLGILKQHLIESEKALYELQIEVRKKSNSNGFSGREEKKNEEFEDMVTTCEEQKKLIENLLIKIFHLSLFCKNKELSNIE